jgi:hypothetical protein
MIIIFLKNNNNHNNNSRNKGEKLTIIVDIVGVEQGGYDIYRNWEDYGAVVLCGDTAQGLEVPQLENRIYLISDKNVFNLFFSL